LPQSRHRKTTKARKRPKGLYPTTAAAKPPAGRNRQARIIAIVVVLVLAASAVAYLIVKRAGTSPPPEVAGPEITTPSGLKYSDQVIGTGATPLRGQTMFVRYTGKLADGTKFDSSYDHPGQKPLEFELGGEGIIDGWQEGIASMKVGGKRKLIVPPSLAYGKMGRPPKIPANATLTFDVELVDAK
jgi:FKBP-type peptidyl-prolyl cis-trans isomerase